MRKKVKNPVGRPSKVTPKLLAKLDDAFALGHTDEEACLIAGIDPKTLYNYCGEHTDYSSKKELLKQSPKLVARRNIITKLKAGDVELSKWYLERKAKTEFSAKLEVDNEVGVKNTDALVSLARDVRAILEKPQE